MPTSAAVKTPLQTPTDDYETSEEERAIGKAIAEHLMEQEVEATIKQIPKRTGVKCPFCQRLYNARRYDPSRLPLMPVPVTPAPSPAADTL